MPEIHARVYFDVPEGKRLTLSNALNRQIERGLGRIKEIPGLPTIINSYFLSETGSKPKLEFKIRKLPQPSGSTNEERCIQTEKMKEEIKSICDVAAKEFDGVYGRKLKRIFEFSD